MNNGGYTIEVEIHDGPYNVIKNWNYTGLVEAIHNGEGKCWTAKVISIFDSNHLSKLLQVRITGTSPYLTITDSFNFHKFVPSPNIMEMYLVDVR